MNLGTTGAKVSRLCLGMMTYGPSKWREWALYEEASKPLIRRAVEAGVNFFDITDMYAVGVSSNKEGVSQERDHYRFGVGPESRTRTRGFFLR